MASRIDRVWIFIRQALTYPQVWIRLWVARCSGEQPLPSRQARTTATPPGRTTKGYEQMNNLFLAIGFGLITASIRALSTVVLSLPYGVTNMPPVAHGELLTLGAYGALVTQNLTGTVILATVVAATLGGGVNWLMNWGLLQQLGLVTQVVPSDDLLTGAVDQYIQTLRGFSPRVHREIKAFLRVGGGITEDAAYDLTADRLVLGSLARLQREQG